MAYGHAERNLAVIRQLEAETRQLLSHLAYLDQERGDTTGTAAEPPSAEGLRGPVNHRLGMSAVSVRN